MTSIAAQKTALNTELQAVVTSGEIACALWGRSRVDMTGYPAVRYYFNGIENELLAGGAGGSDYRRTVTFKIDVIQEKEVKDPSTAEDDFVAAIDAIMNRLEENYDLAGVGDILIPPFSSEAFEEEGAAGRIVLVPLFASPRSIISY